jgi:hypothetical protein
MSFCCALPGKSHGAFESTIETKLQIALPFSAAGIWRGYHMILAVVTLERENPT